MSKGHTRLYYAILAIRRPGDPKDKDREIGEVRMTWLDTLGNAREAIQFAKRQLLEEDRNPITIIISYEGS